MQYLVSFCMAWKQFVERTLGSMSGFWLLLIAEYATIIVLMLHTMFADCAMNFVS